MTHNQRIHDCDCHPLTMVFNIKQSLAYKRSTTVTLSQAWLQKPRIFDNNLGYLQNQGYERSAMVFDDHDRSLAYSLIYRHKISWVVSVDLTILSSPWLSLIIFKKINIFVNSFPRLMHFSLFQEPGELGALTSVIKAEMSTFVCMKQTQINSWIAFNLYFIWLT